MNSDNERVTIVLPKTLREASKKAWNLNGSKFNYSQVIREAVTVFLRGKDDSVSG